MAALPILAEPGLLNTRGGGDSPFLLQRLHQLESALLDGHFPVRWMPDANYGYGYPFFNYYAPLSIYIAALFRLLGLSFVRAIHLAQLSGFVVAASGMFALGRRWFGSDWAGLLTAVAYTVAPFHLINVYVRGDSLAEFWAMAFYPLVILSAENLFTPAAVGKRHAFSLQGRRNIALFALAYAALILSHNISAMIFSPFLLIFLLLKAGQHHPFIPSLRAPAAILLALALAAWFFIPALADQGQAQLDAVTEGYFDYSVHFLATDELSLVQDSFFFDYTVRGRRAFRMGLVQAVAGVASLVALGWRLVRGERPYRSHSLFIILTILIATLMMTRATALLWEHLPLLSFTQFPWRFLSVQAFGLALAAGALATLPRPRLVVVLVGALLLVSSFGQLKTDHLILSDADVSAERLAQYEWFTGNIGTTVSAEYLPTGVQPRPYTSRWLNTGNRYTVTTLSGQITDYQLLKAKTTQQTWRITAVEPSTVVLPLLDWPGWRATIDGNELAIQPAPGSGLMTLPLPPGTHTVDIELTRTPTRRSGELISLAALILTLALVIPSPRHLVTPSPRHPVTITLLTLAIIALINHALPNRDLSTNNLTWDFANMGYLHHDVDGAIYDDGSRLLRYDYSTETAASGETLTIEIVWDGRVEETAVALVTPASNRPEFDPAAPELISAQGRPNGEGSMIYQLIIPDNAPAGLYMPRVSVADRSALTSAGESRSRIHLRPIRVVNKDSDPTNRLDVRVSEATLVDDDILRLGLVWQISEPTTIDYNVALRLTDASGAFLRLADRQPGYGYLPSSGWEPEALIHDLHLLPIPPEAEEHAEPFVLVTQLYDVRGGDVALTRRLGELDWQDGRLFFTPTQPKTALPAEVEANLVPQSVVFDDEIALRGYTLDQTEGTLTVTLVWEALRDGMRDATRFVHLLDASGTGAPLRQSDSFPQQNNYATSQWTAGEIVVDRVTLDVADLPAGEYALAVGLYEVVDGEARRWTAVDDSGAPLPDNRLIISTGVPDS